MDGSCMLAGLDLENDTIIEAACLMSDGNLETTIEVCKSSSLLRHRGHHLCFPLFDFG